jgi:hypothetical protein
MNDVDSAVVIFQAGARDLVLSFLSTSPRAARFRRVLIMSSVDLPIPTSHLPARSILRWICTSNPFYVISAGLFLFGLRVSFVRPNDETDSWALMIGLAGYTALLAIAALILVRFAGVWNDVRTILLLVVLMFLATSVTFDELLVLNPRRGTLFYLGGFAFAIAITEGLLRTIRLRLPTLFRVPYYLVLALFFLYPIALVPLVDNPHSEILMWGLWGFSPVAGLIFLTLLPAIRRGPSYIRDNGSPWPWPYFPWSVFVFLAVAVCGRAFLLCWSFHLLPSNGGQLIFDPYFLIPFGLALAVLVLELGLVSESRTTQWIALVAPLALAAMTGIVQRDDPISREFLGFFTSRLGGTPLFLACMLAAGFYSYAWMRRVTVAPECLTAVLLALTIIGPDTDKLRAVIEPQPVPIVAAVLLQMWLGLWRRDALRLIFCVLIVAGGLGSVVVRWYRSLREQIPGLDFLVLGLVLLPIAVLVSLGKAGILSRWVAARKRRIPSSME